MSYAAKKSVYFPVHARYGKTRLARCGLKTPKLRSTTHTLNGAARIAILLRRADLRSTSRLLRDVTCPLAQLIGLML